jgi:hypothetical protein
VPLLFGNAEPDQFGLRALKISVHLAAWRLPPLAPQVFGTEPDEIAAAAEALRRFEPEHPSLVHLEVRFRRALQIKARRDRIRL